MKNSLLVPELREQLAKNDSATLRAFLEAVHPADAAESLSGLEPDEAWRALVCVDARTQSEIFPHFDPEVQSALIAVAPAADFASLIAEMAPDDRVDILDGLADEERGGLLRLLAETERENILRLSAHSPQTAGAAMTSHYAAVPPHLSAAEALRLIRQQAPNKETIYYVYVVDADRKLVGIVSLFSLVMARSEEKVDDMMTEDFVAARVNEDQESVARKIEKYDLIALPVVDNAGVLVGIVTHDDALDIIRQEHQEDLEKIMAIAGSHEADVYLRTPATTHFRNRVGWVVALAALSLISGAIIHEFEDTLAGLLILALYMPMLSDTGGNVGSQSATVVIRALAVGEVKPSDAGRILAKEFVVAGLMAIVLGLLAFGKVLMFSRGAKVPVGITLTGVAGVIALALSFQVLSATLIGALLPLGASKLKIDPALLASPALTTVCDITGLLIYFSCARMILGV
jgi:magnesium transporter